MEAVKKKIRHSIEKTLMADGSVIVEFRNISYQLVKVDRKFELYLSTGEIICMDNLDDIICFILNHNSSF